MAHPDRAGWVEGLVDALAPATPRVVWDEGRGEWDTGRRALLARDPAVPWHLVIQDDALVGPDLMAGVEAALRVVPDPACVSFYLGRTRPFPGRTARYVDAADAQDARWIVMPDLMWGVALALPTGLIPRLVADQDRSGLVEYDRRIGRWCARQGIPVWYSWPSLVDHRDGPSLLAHDRKPGERRAWRWLGDTSPLTVDWTGPVVRPPERAARAVVHVTQRPPEATRRPRTPRKGSR